MQPSNKWWFSLVVATSTSHKQKETNVPSAKHRGQPLKSIGIGEPAAGIGSDPAMPQVYHGIPLRAQDVNVLSHHLRSSRGKKKWLWAKQSLKPNTW